MVLSETEKQMQSLFMKAMQQCSWVAGIEGIEIPHMPGYREIKTQIGDFKFEERYNVTSGKSFTQVSSKKIISRDGDKVWVMSSKGHCRNEDLSFFRRALRQAYSAHIFNTVHIEQEEYVDEALGLAYVHKAYRDDFAAFSGRGHLSSIFGGEVSPQIVGRCDYFGEMVCTQ